jgi:hypothetical protein
MEQRDDAERSIRNLRQRGWHVVMWLFIWVIGWMGSAVVLEGRLSPPRYATNEALIAWLVWIIFMLATYFFILVCIGRLPPKRLNLSDVLWIVPGPTVKPKDVRGFHFDRDPDEDYVESKSPVPTCQLTVELRKRKLRMIISLADASRVSDWAEQHGVSVNDPQKYANRGVGR